MKKILFILSLISLHYLSNAQQYQVRLFYGADTIWIKNGSDSLYTKSGEVYTFFAKSKSKNFVPITNVIGLQSVLDLKSSVGHSHSYNSLSNLPSLFSGSYVDLTNKPTLATVATTGSYNDLTNRPTISGTNTGDVTTSAFGYATGAGGTVTQATNKSTGVTLSKLSGQITMTSSALAANTNVTFTLTNTNIASTDVLILNHASGGTAGAYNLNAQCGNGTAAINVRNVTAGSLSEAIVIRFVLIKAVTN